MFGLFAFKISMNVQLPYAIKTQYAKILTVHTVVPAKKVLWVMEKLVKKVSVHWMMNIPTQVLYSDQKLTFSHVQWIINFNVSIT
jgi:hypothetical protein